MNLIVMNHLDVNLKILQTDVGMMISVMNMLAMNMLDVPLLLYAAMIGMLALMTGVTLILDANIPP
jgi:hypothetical protein